jgi:hypothetical protein
LFLSVVNSPPILPALPSRKSTTANYAAPIPVINISTDASLGKRGAREEESVVSEERQGGRLSIRGQHDRQRRKRKDSSPAMSMGSGASTPVSAAEDGAQPLTMKRLKTATDEETPSLLLRMGHHPRRLSPAAGSRNTSKSRSSQESQSQRSHSPRRHGPPSAGMPDISLGISIKGAARSHSHSLLERIQGNGTG